MSGPAAAAPGPPQKLGAPATLALPDIYGPGAVLRAGDVRMKVTNFGHVGNLFPNLSTDPAGQWPDSSGVEYLYGISLAVGAVDYIGSLEHPRRTSYLTHWRPATLDPADRIYAAYDGIVNGIRFVNDDFDFDPIVGMQLIDEEFLDGRDNDGDGLIDEDFGALGAQLYSCMMRDDTPQAMEVDTSHIPLGLECRQTAWCASRAGFTDFNIVEYTIINRSGHTLDSLYVGWSVDMDVGPTSVANYFMDDQDLPGYPGGEFLYAPTYADPRRQLPHSPVVPVPADSALCPRWPIRVNGFALRDGDGDDGVTPGTAAFLLVDHTIDPTGYSAPPRVGFRAFRSFTRGTPFASGGNPSTSEERYELMSGSEGIDPSTGFIDASPGAVPGDYSQWCSIGPFLEVPNGGSVRATIAFAVQSGSQVTTQQYSSDYQAYRAGALGGRALLAAYPLLRTAFDIQVAFDGVYELRDGFLVPDFHGRETGIRLPPGTPPQFVMDCDGSVRLVTDQQTTWFDMDCDYCTGAWSYPANRGYFHRTWVFPPPALVDAPAAPTPRIARWAASPNPATDVVRFEIAFSGAGGPAAGTLRIGVFDLAGRQVREIQVGGDVTSAAPTWDLTDAAGHRVKPGLYFCRALMTGEDHTVRVAVVD